jgi:transposase-like protein
MGAITTELVETGEKRDARGRRVTPQARRSQCVQAYRESGLTMAAFARREKLNYATFAGWVAKAGKVAAPRNALQFAQVRLPFPPLPVAAASALEVRLPDGTSVRGSSVAEVAALVRALRS